MPLVLVKERKARKQTGKTVALLGDEIVALCPKCKTLETLCLEGGKLAPTQKFSQRGSQIYHDCGSDEPCCLYRVL
jgi:hypothetical protein